MNASPPPQDLNDAEKVARLRLIRTENVGPVTFARLMARFGAARPALDALPDMAARGGRAKPLSICSQTAAEDELATLAGLGAEAVFMDERAYPPLLRHIDDAPPILFVRGHLGLLNKKTVAVVGSRNASVNGKRFAEHMARALGDAGYLVASGMARGIDAAAHQGALATGTLAVLGGGVDVVYPREHEALYASLVERGAVCSEIRCGVVPQARHFPRRNRIISGVARAIVVLEAGAKSGSLITARMALEQGREVFAVPGAPQDPRVKGANTLIRDGAHLTECAGDVINVLAGMNFNSLHESRTPPFAAAATPAVEEPTRQTHADIAQALGYGPTDVDDVIRETGLSPAAIALALLELELAGRIERHAGNRVSLLSG